MKECEKYVAWESCRKHLCRPKSLFFFFSFYQILSHAALYNIADIAKKGRQIKEEHMKRGRMQGGGKQWQKWATSSQIFTINRLEWYSLNKTLLVKHPLWNLTCILNSIKTPCAETAWLYIRELHSNDNHIWWQQSDFLNNRVHRTQTVTKPIFLSDTRTLHILHIENLAHAANTTSEAWGWA